MFLLVHVRRRVWSCLSLVGTLWSPMRQFSEVWETWLGCLLLFRCHNLRNVLNISCCLLNLLGVLRHLLLWYLVRVKVLVNVHNLLFNWLLITIIKFILPRLRNRSACVFLLSIWWSTFFHYWLRFLTICLHLIHVQGLFANVTFLSKIEVVVLASLAYPITCPCHCFFVFKIFRARFSASYYVFSIILTHLSLFYIRLLTILENNLRLFSSFLNFNFWYLHSRNELLLISHN